MVWLAKNNEASPYIFLSHLQYSYNFKFKQLCRRVCIALEHSYLILPLLLTDQIYTSMRIVVVCVKRNKKRKHVTYFNIKKAITF